MFAYSKLTYIYFGSLRRLQFLTSRLTINWALSSKLQSEQADFGSRKPRLVNQGQEKAYESIVHISSSIFISFSSPSPESDWRKQGQRESVLIPPLLANLARWTSRCPTSRNKLHLPSTLCSFINFLVWLSSGQQPLGEQPNILDNRHPTTSIIPSLLNALLCPDRFWRYSFFTSNGNFD